jgi:hypothetical protein
MSAHETIPHDSILVETKPTTASKLTVYETLSLHFGQGGAKPSDAVSIPSTPRPQSRSPYPTRQPLSGAERRRRDAATRLEAVAEDC